MYNHKEYMKEYRQRPEVKARKVIRDAIYRDNNRESLRERGKLASSIYRKKNTDKRSELCAKRRARKNQAIPSWSNDEFNLFVISEAYSLSKLRKDLTGIDWHVDHIIPLKNDLVCGLHVWNNLQVITSFDNIKKSNTYNIL